MGTPDSHARMLNIPFISRISTCVSVTSWVWSLRNSTVQRQRYLFYISTASFLIIFFERDCTIFFCNQTFIETLCTAMCDDGHVPCTVWVRYVCGRCFWWVLIVQYISVLRTFDMVLVQRICAVHAICLFVRCICAVYVHDDGRCFWYRWSYDCIRCMLQLHTCAAHCALLRKHGFVSKFCWETIVYLAPHIAHCYENTVLLAKFANKTVFS